MAAARREYTQREYAEMHLLYGFCHGNGRAAAREYRQRYPNRDRFPDHRVFIHVHNAYTEGVLPGQHAPRAGRPVVRFETEDEDEMPRRVRGANLGRKTRSTQQHAASRRRQQAKQDAANRLAQELENEAESLAAMGKEDKEDSGFGFKDKAKAEETLRLLEAHDVNYRRLTVRGLLGRAKRVLSMTKAEDKIKNIKEAMEVFEKWLEELSASKESNDHGNSKKTEKKQEQKEEKKDEKREEKKEKKRESSSDKESSSDVEMDEEERKPQKPLASDSVPGLGFKDKEAAQSTLKELEGRDPDYQRLAVKGLIGRAKRVLTCTRDETKLSNIKEAMSIFEQFLDDFETQHLSRQNNSYLTLGLVRTALKLAGDDVSEQQKEFTAAYSSVRGEYKRLRTVPSAEGEKTWDIVRNHALKELKEKYADAKLFTEKDEPTKEHLQMLLWAYSPEPARAKKLVPETSAELDASRKRRGSADHSPAKRAKE